MGNFLSTNNDVIKNIAANFAAEQIRIRPTEENMLGQSIVLNVESGQVDTTAVPKTDSGQAREAQDNAFVHGHKMIRMKARFGKFVYNMINFLIVFTGMSPHGYKYQIIKRDKTAERDIQFTDKPEKIVSDIVNLADGILDADEVRMLEQVVPHFLKECVKLHFMTSDEYAGDDRITINEDGSVTITKTTGNVTGNVRVAADSVRGLVESAIGMMFEGNTKFAGGLGDYGKLTERLATKAGIRGSEYLEWVIKEFAARGIDDSYLHFFADPTGYGGFYITPATVSEQLRWRKQFAEIMRTIERRRDTTTADHPDSDETVPGDVPETTPGTVPNTENATAQPEQSSASSSPAYENVLSQSKLNIFNKLSEIVDQSNK